MKYLTLTIKKVLELYSRIFANLGGKVGIRDVALFESAINQPKASFGGHDFMSAQ